MPLFHSAAGNDGNSSLAERSNAPTLASSTRKMRWEPEWIWSSAPPRESVTLDAVFHFADRGSSSKINAMGMQRGPFFRGRSNRIAIIHSPGFLCFALNVRLMGRTQMTFLRTSYSSSRGGLSAADSLALACHQLERVGPTDAAGEILFTSPDWEEETETPRRG